jgi:hypothetical protein
VYGRSRGRLLHECELRVDLSDSGMAERELMRQAGAIAACLGAEPAIILQAAEIGIERVLPTHPKFEQELTLQT